MLGNVHSLWMVGLDHPNHLLRRILVHWVPFRRETCLVLRLPIDIHEAEGQNPQEPGDS